jgi:antitoxin (DNA-binding transcriptional repressor) of toxin-antitoxin stability system
MDMIVNVHEAKTHYSKLLKRVMSGERIIIDTNFPKLPTV